MLQKVRLEQENKFGPYARWLHTLPLATLHRSFFLHCSFWNSDFCTPCLPTLGTGSPAQTWRSVHSPCGPWPHHLFVTPEAFTRASGTGLCCTQQAVCCFQPRVSGLIAFSPFLLETPNASYQASPAWSQRLFHRLALYSSNSCCSDLDGICITSREKSVKFALSS